MVLPAVVALPLVAQVGGRATRPKVQRPDGPVWEVIRKNCIACHGIDDYAFYAQDRAAWQKLIAAKHKPGEATLSDADQMFCWTGWCPNSARIPSLSREPTFRPRSPLFFPIPKPRRLMNRACTTVMGWIGWRARGMRKKPGESRWWTCGSGALNFPTRNWSDWWNGWAGCGERIRINEMQLNLAIAISGIMLASAWLAAELPESGPILSFTATTENVARRARFHPDRSAAMVHRCRARPLMSAWNMTGGGRDAPGGAADVAQQGGGRAGRGGRGWSWRDEPLTPRRPDRPESSTLGRGAARTGAPSTYGAICGLRKLPDMRFAMRARWRGRTAASASS